MIKRHAKKRAKERFGLKLTNKNHATIIASIQGGNATYIKEAHQNREMWLVTLLGRKIKVVYDPEKEEVITLMFLGKDPRQKPKGRVYCRGQLRDNRYY